MGTTSDYFINEVIPSVPYPKPELYANAQKILGATNAKVKDFDVAKMLDSSYATKAEKLAPSASSAASASPAASGSAAPSASVK